MEVPELDARDWNARQYLLPGTRESDLEQHVRQQPHRVRMAWRHWADLRTSLPAPSHAFLQLMLCLRALDVRVPRDVRQLLFQAVLAHWCWPVLDGIAKLPKCLYLFRPLRVRTFAAGTVVVRSLVARSQVLCGRHKYCGIPLDPACVECATEKVPALALLRPSLTMQWHAEGRGHWRGVQTCSGLFRHSHRGARYALGSK